MWIVEPDTIWIAVADLLQGFNAHSLMSPDVLKIAVEPHHRPICRCCLRLGSRSQIKCHSLESVVEPDLRAPTVIFGYHTRPLTSAVASGPCSNLYAAVPCGDMSKKEGGTSKEPNKTTSRAARTKMPLAFGSAGHTYIRRSPQVCRCYRPTPTPRVNFSATLPNHVRAMSKSIHTPTRLHAFMQPSLLASHCGIKHWQQAH